MSDININWRIAGWTAAVAVLLAILYQASGALTPFLIAIVIAYMTAPLVNRLEARGVSRATASCLVLLVLLAVAVLIPLSFLPLFVLQVIELLDGLPAAIERAWSWANEQFSGELRLPTWDDLPELTGGIGASEGALGKAGDILGFFGRNLGSALGALATLVIAPLVAFYLLRDWPRHQDAVKRNIPAPFRPTVVNIASIADGVLSEFLRAQFSVMLVMAVVYSTLLALAGTPFAVAVGTITGLLCFIPYVGFLFGFLLAVIASLLQFESLTVLLLTMGAMALGNVIEGFWLTPKIVGDRTGLGPVAVLLALAVMGSLFGFAGVLLAIPAAAIGVAMWRHYLPAEAGGQ